MVSRSGLDNRTRLPQVGKGIGKFCLGYSDGWQTLVVVPDDNAAWLGRARPRHNRSLDIKTYFSTCVLSFNPDHITHVAVRWLLQRNGEIPVHFPLSFPFLFSFSPCFLLKMSRGARNSMGPERYCGCEVGTCIPSFTINHSNHPKYRSRQILKLKAWPAGRLYQIQVQPRKISGGF